MKRSIIIGAILLVIGIVIGWLCRQSFAHPEVITQRDSIVIVDTVRELYPVAIREEIVDTFLVVVRDTIRLKDTLYLNLPIEKKLYATDEYYAEVSGYRPSLDYIEVYPKTNIVKEYVNQSATSRNTLSFGIEPSYLNTLSIPIYLEYGRMLHKNIEIYGQIAYDLPSKSFGVGAGLKIGFDF